MVAESLRRLGRECHDFVNGYADVAGKAKLPYIFMRQIVSASKENDFVSDSDGQGSGDAAQGRLHHLGVTPGQKVEVDLLPDGRAVLRAAGAGKRIRRFIGCLTRPDTTPLTIEEIADVAAEGWAGRR